MKRPFSFAEKSILNLEVSQKGIGDCACDIDIIDILILDYVKSRALFSSFLECEDEDALEVVEFDKKFYFELSDIEFCHYYPVAGEFNTFWKRVNKLCEEKLLIYRKSYTDVDVYRVSGLYEDIFTKGE